MFNISALIQFSGERHENLSEYIEWFAACIADLSVEETEQLVIDCFEGRMTALADLVSRINASDSVELGFRELGYIFGSYNWIMKNFQQYSASTDEEIGISPPNVKFLSDTYEDFVRVGEIINQNWKKN